MWSWLVRPAPPPLWLGVVVAVAVVLMETMVVVVLKKIAPMDAFNLVYLLGVLVIATAWGFGLASVTAVVSAGALAYFRKWPDDMIDLTSAENWMAVVIFFVVALLANALAGVARARAAEAEERRMEADQAAELAGLMSAQQSALRRVATLVAQGVAPRAVFAGVATELARCLDVPDTAVFRYETGGSVILLAAHDEPESAASRLGARLPLEGDSIAAMVLD
ncbi:MAG: hypothetical protein QOE41_2334, partial [Mycobacterium sp.]|nr:hypothetical protein [Mycobacterium sp.]